MISGVYRIKNLVTGDCYIGSSVDVERRWKHHKSPSTWKEHLNSQMYQDMQKYGLENFKFTMVCFVMPDYLKEVEQEAIEMLKPTYNKYKAYRTEDEVKAYMKDYQKAYKEVHADELKTYQKAYKEVHADELKTYQKAYSNQQCNYNGEILTLSALKQRFKKDGIKHPTIEARKYLIKED